ncbi:YdcF family protein [Actinomadura hibisca]|uniref:YdcF family protein n=1 Tax=Actinomadura hibisca TaxID=68565 RepID=UPI00082F0FB5|nr:YdcF family protein [Actinomadura hibisca]
MSKATISHEQVTTITNFVAIEAPPPEDEPTTHLIFGTSQIQPVEIVANRYHRGLAPLIIATGGVNRNNGIVEGREFLKLLVERGVPDEAIRWEDRSADTWQNVEFSLARCGRRWTPG